MIAFDAVPELGTQVLLDSQAYVLASTEPYTRKDGGASTLLTWHVHCADCDCPFQIKTGLVTKSFARRCPLHRQPALGTRGKKSRPVSGQFGKPIAVEIVEPRRSDDEVLP